MKRFLPAALLAVSVLATGWGASIPSRSPCKPLPPVELEARLVGDAGAPFGLVAAASTRLDADVELDAVLPDGVSVLAGELKRKGKRPELKVDLRARDRGPREIFVRATVEAGGARFTRVVSLPLGPAPAAPRGTLKKNARGETIREFGP
jgi:hypothetical protein